MNRPALDICLTALAPLIWGSTYIVTTTFLPDVPPLTVALWRALPAGLLLLLLARRLPSGRWWMRSLVLGVLNFSLFWFLLFVSAYRLPGGVAATVGAVQPLLVILIARLILSAPIRRAAVVASGCGLAGVALLVLSPRAALDPLGIAAALGGAGSMACGTVLTRRWQPPVPLVVFTAWQLTAGGLVLLPLALALEPLPTRLDAGNVAALLWLGLVGAALTYVLWFRGVARLDLSFVSSLGFLSPVTAVLLGWAVLGQTLSPWQIAGILLIAGGLRYGQRGLRDGVARPVPSRPGHENARFGARRDLLRSPD